MVAMRAQDRELLTAPGGADLTFGSLLSLMIAGMFQRVETLNHEAPHRYYVECKQCGGTDNIRERGLRPQIDRVQHLPDCTLHKHLPRLYAMANEGTT